MLFLTELSVPRARVDAAAKAHDPLVASDPGYAVKTWLATLGEGLTVRPYAWRQDGAVIRVTGWRRTPPHGTAPPGVLVGARDYSRDAGEITDFEAVVTPVERVRGNGKLIEIDAAQDAPDPDQAYRVWALTRLATETAFAIKGVTVAGRRTCRVLSKVERHGRDPEGIKRVIERKIPVATLRLSLEIADPAGLEAWLLAGCSRGKAFGYGCAIPC